MGSFSTPRSLRSLVEFSTPRSLRSLVEFSTPRSLRSLVEFSTPRSLRSLVEFSTPRSLRSLVEFSTPRSLRSLVEFSTPRSLRSLVEFSTPRSLRSLVEFSTPRSLRSLVEFSTPRSLRSLVEFSTPRSLRSLVEFSTPRSLRSLVEFSTPRSLRSLVEFSTPRSLRSLVEFSTPRSLRSLVEFRPARWLKSPHLQTVGAALPLHARPRSFASVAAAEEDLRISVTHGQWAGKLHARARFRSGSGRGPAVLIVHGIAGSKDSLCVLRAGTAFASEGYHVIRLDMRGAGESVVDAPSLYHGGLSSDLDLVVRQLLEDPRISWLTVLGFSGGGSQLLKLAGEWGADVPAGVAAIATVSAPLDYTKVAPRMDTLSCLPYRFHVLRGLVERARALAIHHPERVLYRQSDLDKVNRFRLYDERVIVPMHGFPDVARYYAAASSGRWLSKIEVPTLILHAEDDPMVPIDTVRPWLRDASASVTSRVSRYGGHIGWLGGLDEASMVKGWATASALSFFAAHAWN